MSRNLPSSRSDALAQAHASDWARKFATLTGRALGGLEHTVYVLLDLSGSMAGAKLGAAKEGVAAFAADARAAGYSVGVIGFDSDAREALAPSASQGHLLAVLRSLQVGGSTDMAAALMLGARRLSGNGGRGALCIVTDGQPDDAAATVRAAKEAAAAGITIVAIGTDDADETFLDRIVTGKGLARTVPRAALAGSIAGMSRLLPGSRQ